MLRHVASSSNGASRTVSSRSRRASATTRACFSVELSGAAFAE